MQKKKWLVLAFSVLTILLLAGCGAKTASVSTLKEDLHNSDRFSRFSEQLGMEITDLEVVKRQTDKDDRVDTVWVKVKAAGDTAEGEMYYVMTYNLYNDGWRLETITDDDVDLWHFEPLCAPSEEEVLTQLSCYGDYSILDESLDIENGLKEIDFEYTEDHLYCRKSCTARLACEFESYYFGYEGGNIGGWTYAVFPLDEETVWDVCGTYYCEDEGKGVKFRYQIDKFDVDDLPTYISSEPDNDWYERFSGGRVGGWQYSYGIESTKQFSNMTECALTAGLLDETSDEYCMNYGYTVVSDSFDLRDISYVAAANNWNALLIGPDGIYMLGREEEYRIDGNRTIHVTAVRMIRK